MRLVIATRQLEFAGGVETHLQALLPRLVSAGHSLALLHESAPRSDSELAPDTLLQSLPGVPRFSAQGRPIADLLRDIAAFNPDVVYNHGLASSDLEDAIARRFPTAFFAHNYYGVCISGTRCHAGSTVTPCHRTFGPACLALYLPLRCGGSSPWTMIQRYRAESRRAKTLPLYRAVLVATRFVASQYQHSGIDASRLHIVPLFPAGVTPTPAPPAPRPMSGRVLFLGRITRLKGLELLIEAIHQATPSLSHPLRLVVAGDGPERQSLLALAKSKGVSVDDAGWVNAPKRNQIMAEADLLAVPSVWPEPFGLVGVEAACLGLPSVAFATGGIPEWLVPGVSGELAAQSPPQVPDLAAAIVRALQNPVHWQKLRVGAWNQAREWSAERHMNRLSVILEKVRLQPTPSRNSD